MTQGSGGVGTAELSTQAGQASARREERSDPRQAFDLPVLPAGVPPWLVQVC